MDKTSPQIIHRDGMIADAQYVGWLKELKYIKRWFKFYTKDNAIRQQAVDELEMPNDFAFVSLCSRTVSSSAVLRSYDWAMQLNVAQAVVVSGFQSKLEKDILRLLNKRRASIILILARKMYKEIPDEFQPFLANNRLLVISTSSAIRNAKEAANKRNGYIANMVDDIVFGYINEGTSLQSVFTNNISKSTILCHD